MTTPNADTRPSSRSELAGWYEAALDEQKRRGLSVARYAREIGVTAATLYNWRRRLGSRHSQQPRHEAPGLVRVQVRRESGLSGLRDDALVVRFVGGRSIEVPPHFDADELARVIEVLDAC